MGLQEELLLEAAAAPAVSFPAPLFLLYSSDSRLLPLLAELVRYPHAPLMCSRPKCVLLRA
jgi:hypothetical protein